MYKFEPRMVVAGPDTGKYFCMYKTYQISNPKLNMIHAAFSYEEAIKEGASFSKEHLKSAPVKTVRI